MSYSLRKPHKIQQKLSSIPSGSCVETDAGIYYVKGKLRYRITTDRILNSWSFPRIIKTTESDIKKYPIAGTLGFRAGSLIWNVADGRIYLIEDNRKRHVTSPDVLTALGAKFKDVLCVSSKELELHEEGEEIS